MAIDPLNLICRRRTLDSILEAHFIRHVLLGDIGRPLRTIPLEDGQALPFQDNTLVLSLGLEGADYLRQARRRGMKNLGLFHMGDEHGDHDRTFYADADYVIRNYWFGHVFGRPHEGSLGVIWVPNGYRTGVGPVPTGTMLDVANRSCEGFFSGAIGGRTLTREREDMARVVSEARLPFAILTYSGFAGGFGPSSYAAWLGTARFALIPGGNSSETVRLYDALEAGAIPIMLRSPFTAAIDALDDPPFPLLETWQDLPAFYARYADAQSQQTIESLETLRLSVVKWWNGFKTKQSAKVKQLLARAFSGGRVQL